MFDDFVEHAGSPPSGAPAGPLARSLAAPQYEGFEPSPFDVEDAHLGLSSLEGNNAAAPAGAVFDLGLVQYTLPAPLICMAVSSDVMALGLASATSVMVVFIELARAEQVVQIPIPRKPAEFTLHKLFLDPSGRHLLIASVQGETWYLFRGWTKPRQLKSFKMVLESVAWHRPALLGSAHGTSTREVLLGARNGMIYEALLDAEDDFFRSQERYLQPVYTLPQRAPITGLKFDFFPPNNPTRALIVATTPTRIHQFVGTPERQDGGRLFASIFASYRDTLPKIMEMPGDIDSSELNFFTPNANQASSLPSALAWMTAPGIYHGSLNFDSTSDDFVAGASLLPYPPVPASARRTNAGPGAPPDLPISTVLTEFHFVLLYRDRVLALGALDEALAYEAVLPLKPGEQARGLAADPVRGTYWVYTDQTLFELGAQDEARDVWRAYLARGQHDLALRHATTATQRDAVLASQANALFADGRFFPAAQAYAQCSMPFEDVALRFLDAGERDALRAYLVARLERTRRTDVTQRMMLATWLVEFYLAKCNELDDLVASESVSQDVENLRTERGILEEDLRQFFETYKVSLDPTTVYELIQGHGRTDMYLHFATVVGDLDRVVEHWVLEEEWGKAIDVINRQSDLELYYRFAPVLFRNAPKDAVDSWLRQSALDPLRLVPALLQLQHAPRDPLAADPAVRYLTWAVTEQHATAPQLHNLLLTLHAAGADDGPLLRFLAAAPADATTGRPYFDLDYALRLCARSGRAQACAHIYARMGLWERAVDLALERGDLELARIHADAPEDDRELRKKLWLKIARYVVQDKQDIKAAMRFLEDTDLLQIEDVLPFFPDFVVIDDFKDEICAALERYAAHIDDLKHSMDDAAANAAAVRRDVDALRNRFVTIDAGERCAHCARALLARAFYVFPCQHSFHADCLVGLAKEYLPSHALRKIVALQTQLLKDKPAAERNSSLAAGARNPAVARTLLSAGFAGALAEPARAAGSLGRGLLTAGDKLRDLVVPDALAAVIANPLVGLTGAPRRADGRADVDRAAAERARVELEDLLAASCPLCESVVAGLDKPFIEEGEADTSWDL